MAWLARTLQKEPANGIWRALACVLYYGRVEAIEPPVEFLLRTMP